MEDSKDLNQSIDVVAAIADNFGIKTNATPMEEVGKELNKGYKNVILFVLDGLGTDNLNYLLPENAFLRKHFLQSVSTVYPSTTTAATVSLETGALPVEHGWIGWTMYIPQENKDVNLLINTDRQGKAASPYHVGRHYMPYTPLYEKITSENTGTGNCVSPFGPGGEKTLTLMEKSIKLICNRAGRQYIYAYWPEPDGLMHDFGTKHFKAINGMEKINKRVEALAGRLKDTLIIVTADHGLIDGKNVNLRAEADLWDMLERPPCIEPRCCDFHIKKGMEEAFSDIFQNRFGGDFKLYTKEEALRNGLFGKGKEHPQLERSLGIYIAVALGETSLFENEEKCQRFIGIHAGYTKKEMEVPLIMIPCI